MGSSFKHLVRSVENTPQRSASASAPALLLRRTVREIRCELQRTVAKAKDDALKQAGAINALETQIQEFAARNGQLLADNRRLALETYTVA